MSNEDNFALCKAYPKRFVNICIYFPAGREERLEGTGPIDQRAWTAGGSRSPRARTARAWTRVSTIPSTRRWPSTTLPILIHGTHWECSPLMDMEHAWRFLHVFGWDYDGTQAVWHLIFGGVLDRFPTLKIVTHHLGNYIPFFQAQNRDQLRLDAEGQGPQAYHEYWGNIYGDTAIDGTVGPCPAAMASSDRSACSTVPTTPLVLRQGRLHPENLFCVRSMVIPPEEKARILGGNARRC